MTREQKIAKAQALRAQGIGYAEIGRRLGYRGTTYPPGYRLVHPDKAKAYSRKTNAKRHEIKLAWQRAKDRSPEGRARCVDCGELAGIGSARDAKKRNALDTYRCEDCIAWGALARYRQIEELWNAGKTIPEIQAALGWSKGQVCLYIHRAREQGYDLPYRYRVQNPKFPDLTQRAA